MKMKWQIVAVDISGEQLEQCFCYREGGNAAAERERRNALEKWARAQHSNCICWSVCVVEG